MQRKFIVGGAIAAVLVAAVAWYSTPYIALYSIHRAVERDDADAVSQYVDFPVLRENIREIVMARMAEVAPLPEGGGALASLGQALAQGVANQMVDQLVSPTGVMLLMEGGGALRQKLPQVSLVPQIVPPQPQAEGQPPTPPSTPSDSSAPAAPSAAPSVDAAQLRARGRDVRVSYQGWSQVRVGPRDALGGLIFRRDGLFGWKLVDVEMPASGSL